MVCPSEDRLASLSGSLVSSVGCGVGSVLLRDFVHSKQLFLQEEARVCTLRYSGRVSLPVAFCKCATRHKFSYEVGL